MGTLCCQQVAYCARHKEEEGKNRGEGLLQKNEGNVVVVGTMADSTIVSRPFIKYPMMATGQPYLVYGEDEARSSV